MSSERKAEYLDWIVSTFGKMSLSTLDGRAWSLNHARLALGQDEAAANRYFESVPMTADTDFMGIRLLKTLLDFAEAVMGPFVQMDNLTFIAFPSVSTAAAAGRVSGWHRDIWAFKPTHAEYVPPLAANAITYLQNLTDEYGPLRVIPGSHRNYLRHVGSRWA